MTSTWETLHTFREIGGKVKETNGGFGDGAVRNIYVMHFYHPAGIKLTRLNPFRHL